MQWSCGIPGVVLAYIGRDPTAIGAFHLPDICAIATGYLDDNSRIKRDTVMGIVFSGCLAQVWLLYVSIQSEIASRMHPVWGYAGRIAGDIVQTSVIALGIALIMGLKWKNLLLRAARTGEKPAG